MNPTTASQPSIAKEWDQVRTAFSSSIMVDTALASLAQNLDGLEWPLAGKSETPGNYIDFTHEELVAEFAQRGHPEAAELLCQILRETLSFDQPFGEMVKQTEAAAERDNPLLRALGRLGIPEDFPLELTLLDEGSRQLCRLEQAWTLREFALLAQRLSQGVIVGGDVKRLLNALAHVDERGLAELLPYRLGATGLHLAEAMRQATCAADPVDHTARAVLWFAEEFAAWKHAAEINRDEFSRQLSILREPLREKEALVLLAPHLRAAAPSASPKRSSWSNLMHWLRP
jgi:hypothetical protein